MLTSKNYIIIVLSSVSVLFHCCIDDNITPPLTGDLNLTAEMLVYFEGNGDFANSYEAPALVNAEEVYANLNSYLIIDIRQLEDFAEGRIEESVNVPIVGLYNYFENLNTSNYPKIILISKNGQSSAYFTCLLRLAGFKNVYTMNFGLASWNEYFADEWLNAVGDDPLISNYINDPVPKNDYTTLPTIIFENPNAPLETRVLQRIKKIISEGFSEGIQYRKNLIFSVYDYLVCYGISDLYYAPQHGPGHNPAAVLYQSDPVFELRSFRSLQTLPTDNTIFIYDENGQMGACMTAYLRVLGYDAKTLLFGGNQLIYHNRMFSDADLIPFAFSIYDIKNYPYVTGE